MQINGVHLHGVDLQARLAVKHSSICTVFRQLAHRIRSHPARGFGVLFLNAPRGLHGGFTQERIAFTDLAQCPVDRFLDEVSEKVVIRWPSGKIQTIVAPEIGKIYKIKETV